MDYKSDEKQSKGLNRDEMIRQCAVEVEGTKLITKLSKGDYQNLEAIPHMKEVFIAFRDDLAAAIKFPEYTNSDGKL